MFREIEFEESNITYLNENWIIYFDGNMNDPTIDHNIINVQTGVGYSLSEFLINNYRGHSIYSLGQCHRAMKGIEINPSNFKLGGHMIINIVDNDIFLVQIQCQTNGEKIIRNNKQNTNDLHAIDIINVTISITRLLVCNERIEKINEIAIDIGRVSSNGMIHVYNENKMNVYFYVKYANQKYSD